MATRYDALIADPRLIPFVYDYCDMRCPRCRVPDRCLMEVARRAGLPQEEDPASETISLLRAVVSKTTPEQRAIAKLDVSLCKGEVPGGKEAVRHPLHILAHHYTLCADRFLASLDLPEDGPPEGSPLDVVTWHHDIIDFKTFRALLSHRASGRTPALLQDALAGARSILDCIDRSLEAWRSIAEDEKDDARVGGLMEMLEALRTGLEIRFPEAREFVRPGLDE